MSPLGLIFAFSAVTAEKILTPEDSAKNGVVTTRHRVQLRQHVQTTYPAARTNALFSSEDFGIGQTFEEKRVCWLNVPATATLAEIQKKLDQMDAPKLVRALSLKPILSEDQLRTIENGVNPKSYDDYLGDFVVNGGEDAVLYKGQKQYRKITFSKSFVEDEDNRSVDYNQMVKESGKGVQLAQSAEGKSVPASI